MISANQLAPSPFNIYRGQSLDTDDSLLPGQFNAFAFNSSGTKIMRYIRRDFYKISLYVIGSTQVQYAGQTLVIDRPALMFYNPLLPYACYAEAPLTGFFCLFTELFLMGADRDVSLQESPLFRIDSCPLFYLNEEQARLLGYLFRQMLTALESTYVHKYELIRTYVQQVVHEAQQMSSDSPQAKPKNAAESANGAVYSTT